MKKIIILDCISIGHVHENFNTAFLLSLLYQGYNVDYYADKTSVQAISNLLRSNTDQDIFEKVKFSNLRVVKGTSSVFVLTRYLWGTILNLYGLFGSRGSKIVFVQNNPLFIWLMPIISIFKKKEIETVCHGELEMTIEHFPVYKPRFLYKKLQQSFFNYCKIPKNVKFILLGESIFDNFIKIYPRVNRDQFKWIDHPYIFQSRKFPLKIISNKLIIGTVGLMESSKGLSMLVELSNSLSKYIIDGRLEIKVIGAHNLNINNYPYVNFISKDGGMLDTNVFYKEINKLDYILYFYRKESYQLKASGAILDAINLEKPIISLNNDYFEYIFNKVGAFGFLVEDIHQMENIIAKLINQSSNLHFDFNFKKIKQTFLPQHNI